MVKVDVNVDDIDVGNSGFTETEPHAMQPVKVFGTT